MRTLPLSLISLFLLVGCSSMYYGTWEKLGWHKRDILVERVEDARDEQEGAKEQFRSALDSFMDVVEVAGGDLADRYEALNTELIRSEGRAQAVGDRIESIEAVADALFDEWEDELGQYSSRDLRRRSEEKLEDTRQRYEQLIRAMQRAADRMEPVLAVFRDHVLFLKHNLNAQAVASLKDEFVELETDVAALIVDMERAIAEAEDFLASMSTTE